MAGPARFVVAVLATINYCQIQINFQISIGKTKTKLSYLPVGSVGSGAVDVLVCWIEAPNVGRTGFAAGVPNDNVFDEPNAGVDVAAAGTAVAGAVATGVPNDKVELVVAGVPNDRDALGAAVEPVNE